MMTLCVRWFLICRLSDFIHYFISFCTVYFYIVLFVVYVRRLWFIIIIGLIIRTRFRVAKCIVCHLHNCWGSMAPCPIPASPTSVSLSDCRPIIYVILLIEKTFIIEAVRRHPSGPSASPLQTDRREEANKHSLVIILSLCYSASK